ncbi:MAG: tetraacyldisaccharide 4'-kinase [Candidatus Aminicenantes bacterium]|nr:tetraacyldisaccharide 4'-kinase [Candidatus Aminicenantes bacterium]
MKTLLYLYSLGSRGVSRIKDKLFQVGLFSPKKVGLKVISVGNISLGGTGKGLAGLFAPATSPTGVSATTGRKPFFTNSSCPA